MTKKIEIEISHEEALQLILVAGTLEENGLSGLDDFLGFAGRLCDKIERETSINENEETQNEQTNKRNSIPRNRWWDSRGPRETTAVFAGNKL